jgi:hypothetical protein
MFAMKPNSERVTVKVLLVLATLPLLCLTVAIAASWASPSGSDTVICAVWLPGTRSRAGMALGWYPKPLPSTTPCPDLCRSPIEWYRRLGLDVGDLENQHCTVNPRPNWLSEEGGLRAP